MILTNKTATIISAFLLMISIYPLNAQRIISKTYTMDNGLSSNKINSIKQDSCGFIWFGTNNGLNRFDGIRFKTYYYSEQQGALSSNCIYNIFIDKHNKMWVASDSSIDIYDSQTDTFRKFEVQTDDGEKIQAPVSDIVQDLDGEIWIATYGSGLFRYSETDNRLQVYRYKEGAGNTIPQNSILTLCADSRGNIWLGTYSKGLSCFNKYENTFTNYPKQIEENAISDNSINKIYEDSYGNIWIGTFRNGLYLFRHSTGSFTNYKQTDTGNNVLYQIHNITEYTPGELLIASDNGLGVFSIAENRMLKAEETSLGICKVANKFIYCVYIDKEESLWLGSYFDGVQFYSGLQNNFEYFSFNSDKDSKAGKVINVIREDAKGNFWIGTDDNGIFRFDPKTKAIVPFHTAKDIGSSYYCIHDIVLDDEKMYVATYGQGVQVFDLATGRIKSYQYDANDSTSVPSSRIYTLHKGNDGRIYAGTLRGFCYYDARKDNFVRIEPNSWVTSITEGEQGKIWIGTAQNGLYTYDLKTGKLSVYEHNPDDKNSLIRNNISCLAVDRKKQLWIGTSGYGICRYDDTTDSFIRYPDLNLPNNVITSIIPKGDNLWITTNKGLVHYNPGANITKIYSKANGLYNEQFTNRSSFESSDGRIFLGTTDGLCIFSPQNLQENTYNAPVVLTGITVNSKELRTNDEDSPLDASAEYLEKLTLNHKQSMVDFEFASLSYIAPGENQYWYMLKGFDENWRFTKGDNSRISYTNLPAGDYTLRVMATNSDKVWSTNEIHLPVKVLPPFYRSSVAYFLYIFLAMVLITLLLLHFIQRGERRHRLGIEKINAEKEKELYNSKIEFFTQIAHEIRTPLSLIFGPLEFLMKSRAINDIYGDYLSMMEQNYKRLYALVNQLLDFRKVDSGIYHISYNQYPLKELILKIISIFELTARQRNIRIDTSGIPEELKIITDEEAMTKILTNLVANSVKHTHSCVAITARETKTDILITVTDDGAGIADKDKERIFDAFYQAKNNLETTQPGIGIGLHISRSLVNLLGGEISAKNREDNEQGLSISIRLPKKEKTVIDIAASKNIESFFILDGDEDDTTIQEEPAEETFNRQYSVLVVDDNHEILDFLSKILSTEYFVISALSGKEALKILEINQVDMVISDVMMDEMDGFELCKHVKTVLNTSHIPVVLLTAKTDTESKVEGLQSGADAYIEKPFSPYHLKAQLQNLIKKRNELKENYASTPLSEIHLTTHNNLDKEFMDKCSDIIHNYLSDSEFSVDTLAKELGMSRTPLFAKVKGITGLTPNDFIKVTRLKTACKMMVETDYRITEIGFMVGFSSSSYFAKCFQKQFGVLPTEFVKNLKEDSSSDR